MKINLETRVGRMLAGATWSKKGKVVITVSVFDATEKRLHQAFRLRAWEGRDGNAMLTCQVEGSGDWGAGIKPVSLFHVTADGRVLNAKDERGRNRLLQYAGRVALEYATTGAVPTPSNGRVEAVEQDVCGICGTELTDPVSIERGIGPQCYGEATKSGALIEPIRQLTMVDAE